MKNKFNKLRVIIDIFPFLWTKQEKIRSLLILSLCLVAVSICFNISIPLILKKIVSELSLIKNNNMGYNLILLISSYGIIWTLSQMIEHIRQIIMIRPLERSIRLFCSSLFEHIHSLPMKFHLDRKTGAITSALDYARQGFPDVFWSLFLLIIPTIIELLLATLIITHYYGIQYGFVLMMVAIIFVIFTLYSTEIASYYQELSNAQQSHTNGYIVDSLLNFASVKYFNNRSHEVLKCSDKLRKLETLLIKMTSSMEYVRVGQRFIIGMGLLLLTFMAAKQALIKGFGVEDFILINGYILQFAAPLRLMGFATRDFKRGVNSLSHVMEVYKIQSASSDFYANTSSISRVESLEFKNVFFSYEPSSPILSDINFYLKTGKSIGIVGGSGSGKSTIANLVFKFFDLKAGEILINNKNIQAIEPHSFYKTLGIVPQDINLFNTSIYENILFARPNARKAEVEEVIALAQLEPVLKKLPEHYNTIVGERGLKLSGGEKQRIAMARILLKKPSLYIFDEATSSLDSSTEAAILKNIKPILENAASLIIAHRLSTVVNADQIIVLEGGVIKECGSHSCLLKKQGLYASMWKTHEDV
jgi:ABC-type transport system involved in Fe-S cluster assembly fused permease/ATPase subunit